MRDYTFQQLSEVLELKYGIVQVSSAFEKLVFKHVFCPLPTQ